MDNKILIIQNISHEGPGLLLDILLAHEIGYDIIDLSKGEIFPSPNAYRALIVFRGSDSANDSSDKMIGELQKIEQILEDKIPYLGICLGFQMLAKASGGAVITCPKKEIGLKSPDGKMYEVRMIDKAKNDPIFSQQDKTFHVFQLHDESIEVTKGIQVLAVGNECKNQFIKVGENAYGIQGHLELTPKMLKSWLKNDADLTKLNQQQLLDDFTSQFGEYRRHGLLLFSNFLRLAGVIT